MHSERANDSEDAVSGTPGAPGRVRSVAFRVLVGLVSLFLVVILLPAYPLIAVNWLPGDAWLTLRPDHAPADLAHRLHSLALSVLAWGMLLGIACQVHRPGKRLAPLLVALAVPIAIAAAEMVAGKYTFAGTAPFIVAILLVAALHPDARTLLRPPRWNLPMLGLAAVAAVPWVMYAAAIGHGARGAGAGWEADHLVFTSALATLPVLWGVIGASGRPGWQYAAGAAAVAAAFVGLQSAIFPYVLSGLPSTWAAAALAWCLAYAVAAGLRSRREAAAA